MVLFRLLDSWLVVQVVRLSLRLKRQLDGCLVFGLSLLLDEFRPEDGDT